MLREVKSLDEVVAGDLVAYLINDWGRRRVEIQRVESVTKLWIRTPRATWRRSDGREVGAKWTRTDPKIVPLTQELLDAYRHERLAAWVTHRLDELIALRVEKLPPEVLLKLVDPLLLAGAHAAELRSKPAPPPPPSQALGDAAD